MFLKCFNKCFRKSLWQHFNEMFLEHFENVFNSKYFHCHLFWTSKKKKTWLQCFLKYFQIFFIFEILNEFETFSIGCMKYKYKMLVYCRKREKKLSKKESFTLWSAMFCFCVCLFGGRFCVHYILEISDNFKKDYSNMFNCNLFVYFIRADSINIWDACI